MSQARQHDELPDAENRWRLLALMGPVLTVLLLVLTFLYWQAAEREAVAKRRQAFTAAVDRIAYSLKDRMAAFELVLRGVKGYHDGSDSINRDEFHAYVGALRLPETRPGLQGVAYALDLPADRVDAHTEQMRARGFSSYNVYPLGARALHPHHPHRAPVHRQPQGSGI